MNLMRKSTLGVTISTLGATILGGLSAGFTSTLCCYSTLGCLPNLISTFFLSSLLGFASTMTIPKNQEEKNITVFNPRVVRYLGSEHFHAS
jgi:hypothetical protein